MSSSKGIVFENMVNKESKVGLTVNKTKFNKQMNFRDLMERRMRVEKERPVIEVKRVEKKQEAKRVGVCINTFLTNDGKLYNPAKDVRETGSSNGLNNKGESKRMSEIGKPFEFDIKERKNEPSILYKKKESVKGTGRVPEMFKPKKDKKADTYTSSTLLQFVKPESLIGENEVMNFKDFLDYYRKKDLKAQVRFEIANVALWAKKRFKWDEQLLNCNKSIFGHDSFRNLQKEMMNATLSGRDVFGCLPTGSGKSRIFQLPPCIEKGLSIVIMPLISLIQDQTVSLQKAGIPLIVYSASKKYDKISKELDKIFDDSLTAPRLLFTTPEKLVKCDDLMNDLIRLREIGKLKRIVIDEAHCVSQWGHSFRTHYLGLKKIKLSLKVPLLALTATVTEKVKLDVIKELGMDKNTLCFQASFNRTNLVYEIIKKESNKKHKENLLAFIKSRFDKQCGIIYCSTIPQCQKLEEFLKSKGVLCASYHGKLSAKKRNTIQEEWMEDKVNVMIATTAFGMGINKPDVRFVMHNNMPQSVENYYQESGRAGRDGKKSYCYLFYSESDKNTYIHLMRNKRGSGDKKKADLHNLNTMLYFCSQKTMCRRKFILNFFGEKYDAKDCKKMCDNCIDMENKKTGSIDIKPHVEEIKTLFNNKKLSKVRGNIDKFVTFLSGKSKLSNIKPPSLFSNLKEECVRDMVLQLVYSEFIKETCTRQFQNIITFKLVFNDDVYNLLKRNEKINLSMEYIGEESALYNSNIISDKLCLGDQGNKTGKAVSRNSKAGKKKSTSVAEPPKRRSSSFAREIDLIFAEFNSDNASWTLRLVLTLNG